MREASHPDLVLPWLSLPKTKYVVRWTGGLPERYATQRECREAMKAWKFCRENAGWRVYSTAKGTALIGWPPNWSDDPVPSLREAISFNEV